MAEKQMKLEGQSPLQTAREALSRVGVREDLSLLIADLEWQELQARIGTPFDTPSDAKPSRDWQRGA